MPKNKKPGIPEGKDVGTTPNKPGWKKRKPDELHIQFDNKPQFLGVHFGCKGAPLFRLGIEVSPIQVPGQQPQQRFTSGAAKGAIPFRLVIDNKGMTLYTKGDPPILTTIH